MTYAGWNSNPATSLNPVKAAMRNKPYKPKPIKLILPLDLPNIDGLMLRLHMAVATLLMMDYQESVHQVRKAAQTLSNIAYSDDPIIRSVLLWAEKKIAFPDTPTPDELLKLFTTRCEQVLPCVTYDQFLKGRPNE